MWGVTSEDRTDETDFILEIIREGVTPIIN